MNIERRDRLGFRCDEWVHKVKKNRKIKESKKQGEEVQLTDQLQIVRLDPGTDTKAKIEATPSCP